MPSTNKNIATSDPNLALLEECEPNGLFSDLRLSTQIDRKYKTSAVSFIQMIASQIHNNNTNIEANHNITQQALCNN